MLVLFGSLLLFSSLVDGQSTSASPPPPPPPPGSSNQPTATVPATGTASGTAPVPVPTNTNGGNQTIPTPTQTGPRPTRDPSAPLATINVISPPNRKDNPPLYALGSNILFSWTIDMTKLLLTPTNITLDAIPQSRSKEVYTIGVVPPGTTNYTWTAALQRNDSHPLIEDIYTFRIYDGQVGPYGYLTDGGGYLQSNVGILFGLYYPREYNNATCDCTSNDVQQRCGTCEFSPVTNSAHGALFPSGSAWVLPIAIAVISASLAL
ncbi:hypothetical protein DFQ27_002244 [Actinomortierella ambigua]|uniref:DUF7137 domain-containing protein n=1 Tax=Actinomortierella ambigua TaxID=1343610 RepID=A0A9P6U7J4_9FUNG|nr:hypothetical protein DFQ27_002244 [Actinomortierella ambigua]